MNTTELTDLPLLISQAKASQFILEYLSHFDAEDIDSDSVDLRFELDDADTGSTVSIVDECGKAAESIRALVEALESAQRTISALEKKLAKPVLLPKTNGYWTEQEKAYEEAITLAMRQVRLAGFSIEEM
ncbi:Ead/Ea22-like family protein [Atlantibacter hermannii]|uniref:hypothetical protein n=1 Tax=Atlantibacter hermannii TaxID=565 RepID=UPI003B23F651